VAIHPTAGEIAWPRTAAASDLGRDDAAADEEGRAVQERPPVQAEHHHALETLRRRAAPIAASWAATGAGGAHLLLLGEKAEKVSLKVLDVNGDALFSYPRHLPRATQG